MTARTLWLGIALPAVLAIYCAGPRTAEPWLVDVTQDSGIDFAQQSGAEGDLELPEIMGGGVALADLDSDGKLDIYLIDGVGGNRLYVQDGAGRFRDRTERAGLADVGRGMGVAVGDVDNDGHADLYLTNYGRDVLYRNRGDGTFTRHEAGAEGWSTSACFFDFDRDGWLDVYVARYVVYDSTKRCVDAAGRADYCSPDVFAPAPDVLFRNSGDGSFSNVSAEAGLRAGYGPGLGVACLDFDDDGWPDVFVANDGEANQLWINQGDGTFRDQAVLRGVAYNVHGEAEAGMGVVADDLTGDLTPDLFVTHLDGETHTLYSNRGGARGFTDVSGTAGLGAPSLPSTGFGAAALDLEFDGDLDLVVANGRVTRGAVAPPAATSAPWDHFAERNAIFLNQGQGRFVAVDDAQNAFVTRAEISRGLATGDLDRDGDLDLVSANIESAARVYRNDAPRRGRELVVAAVDPRYRRPAIGARVTLHGAGQTRRSWIHRGFSYLSSAEPVVVFGIGEVSEGLALDVLWPDGLEERFSIDAAVRRVELERGTGQTKP